MCVSLCLHNRLLTWHESVVWVLIAPRSALDPDVRGIVQVKVVHGSWRKEDPHRLSLEVLRFSFFSMLILETYLAKVHWEVP